MRELARGLVQALSHGNVPHSNLYERAQNYLSLIDQGLEEISFAQLYVEGVRLENASKAADEKISEKELPSLETSVSEILGTLLRLHGTFVLSTADGLALLAAEERYQRRPHEEQELREATLAFAQELKSRPDIMDPAAAAFVLRSAEDLGKGTHPERSAIAAVGTTKNAAIVVISGATLGALPVVGGLLIGTAGLIGGGLAALVGVEGLKRAKSFLAISGLVTKGLDQLSEADLASRAGVLKSYVSFVLKIEPALRRLAEIRGQFSWLNASLDWLKKRAVLGHDTLIAEAPAPQVEPALLVEDTITLPVQVNGRKRADVTVARNASSRDIETAALALDAVKRALDGKLPKKVIVVPQRIVNVVA
jgi:hypothetical protein